MSLVTTWLGLELRRRWRFLAVLALLVTVVAATVLAAVAGARRGATALERLRAVTLPADLFAMANDPAFDWSVVRAFPEVAAVAGGAVAPYFVEGLPGFFGYLPPVDAVALRDLERPIVLEGRIPDPRRSDEAVITTGFEDEYGKHVGDTVTLRLLSADQAENPNADWTHPQGPAVPVRIVGVIRSPIYSDQVGGEGFTGITPSAGLFARYPESFIGTHKTYGVINALIRLKRGAADIGVFRRHLLAATANKRTVELQDLGLQDVHRDKVIRFESGCLLVFALTALVAALVLVGQSVSRYMASSLAELAALRAPGLTPRQALAMGATPPTLAAAVGGVTGVGVAVAASPALPIGAAALVEPKPGFDVDVPVLAAGAVAVPLAMLGLALACGALAQFAARSGLADRRSAAAGAIGRLPVPVPVTVGTRFALESRGGVPVRPALFGAVSGVLGVLAAFTFAAGVADASDNPLRFGSTFDLDVYFGEAGKDWGPTADALALLARDPDVIGVREHRVGVVSAAEASVTLYSYDQAGARRVPVIMTEGRLPTGPSQVALAPSAATTLRAKVGDAVVLSGHTMTVSGIGFVVSGPHNDYDDGGWVSNEGFTSLFANDFKYHIAVIALRPGADQGVVMGRLSAGLATLANGGERIALEAAVIPKQLAEVRDLRLLPVLLGVFLVVLAVGAIGHALATAVRRRRHEMAVMRALGMTRWQARGVVATQASVLAAIGLAFGAPLGVVLGRLLWRVVADQTPLFYEPPMAAAALILIAPAALAAANLLAVWPGHRAARLHIGHVLRTE